MKDNSLLLKKTVLGFVALFIFTACDYKKTTIEVGSLFDPTFDFSKSSELTFDENNVEVKNGKVQLKPLDLKHEGDDFNNGSHVGTSFSQINNFLNLSLKPSLEASSVQTIASAQSPHLIGYWRFEDNYSDLISSNIGAPVNNTHFESDSVVGDFSVSLDGVSDFINLGENIFPNELDHFSIMAWIKTTGGNGAIISEFQNGVCGDMLFRTHSSGRLTFSNGGSSFISTGYVNSGNWTHIAVVGDASNTHLYINGAFDSSSGTDLNWRQNCNLDVLIGDSLNSLYPFNGLIDEISIWSTNFSATEIQSLYEGQNSNFTELSPAWAPRWSNIVGYWKMDGNWRDSSGNSNHGVPSGDSSNSSVSQVGSGAGIFDGSGDSVTVLNGSGLNFSTDDFSISTWVNCDSDVGGRDVLSQQDGGGAGRSILQINSGVYGSFLGGTNKPSGVSAVCGAWEHLAISYSQTLGQLKWYINGVLRSEHLFTPESADGNFVIGSGKLGGNFWDGKVDDLAIWNESLNSAEIKNIYNRQKQKYAGYYDSEVIDLGMAISNWPDFSWSTSLPFLKELVGDFDNDGNPDSENSSGYSFIIYNLSKDLVAYWPFNESGYDGSPLELKDLSGYNSTGNLTAGTVPVTQGKFLNAVNFAGVPGERLQVSPSAQLSFDLNTDFTYAVWVKIPLVQNITTTTVNRIYRHSNTTPNFNILNVVNSSSGSEGSAICSSHDGATPVSLTSTIKINDNRWHHIVCKKEGGNLKIYIDGISDGSVPYTLSGTTGLNDFTIGGNNTNNDLTGSVDELAAWSRPLTDNEIQQLYRRGANRIKFQVKSCVDSSCECKSLNTSPVGSATDCDGDTIANALDFDDIYKAEFIGPGGDGTTYYSELFNRRGTDLAFNCGLNTSDSNSNVCVNDEITLGAGPRPTGPVIDYSDFPLEARPDVNQYFQYRVYMEADENTACNGSPCLPELTSVNLNPDGSDKFYGALQEVAANKPISYSAISSLTVTADSCATFQLSPNGSDYYYWSTSSWVLATVPGHRSSKDNLETNIVSFSTQFGRGLLYIKSFLETNASQTQNCSVQSIDINYSRK